MLYAENYLTFNIGNQYTNNAMGDPQAYRCNRTDPNPKNCMPIATYNEMKNLAEKLQKTQGILCALSGCPSNQADQTKQGATISEALETAQKLMDLIHKTNTNMNWGNITIKGLSKLAVAYGGGKVGGHLENHVIYEGNIISNNPIISYVVFQNIYKMLTLLQEALKLSQNNTANSNTLQAQATV
ncbi:outer membrane protein SabB/HopO [Helicobacter acinonychis]|nr:OMP54 [Helicobacter acinonychis]SFZ70846.1 OMP1677 [Helicobacter acinonychis]STP04277.1 outer membrane protein SabB/HopO [Helicobacter acinonychis]